MLSAVVIRSSEPAGRKERLSSSASNSSRVYASVRAVGFVSLKRLQTMDASMISPDLR